jgi:hypothetical protein
MGRIVGKPEIGQKWEVFSPEPLDGNAGVRQLILPRTQQGKL